MSPDEKAACAKQIEAFVSEESDVVWHFVAEYGIPPELRAPQRLEFARAILPFVSHQDERSVCSLVKIAEQAVNAKHHELYRIVGERCLSVDLSSDALSKLVASFVRYSTHNVDRDAWLTPWTKIFVDKGDSHVLRVCADEIERRVRRHEFSSFDHLVTVLCRSSKPESKDILRGLVDRDFQSEPSLSQESREVARATFVEIFESMRPSLLILRALFCTPVACLIESVLNNTLFPPLTDIFKQSLGLTSALTALVIYFNVRGGVDRVMRKCNFERLRAQSENTYLESEAFLNLAEKVYRHLVNSDRQTPELRSLLSALESNALFKDEISKWHVTTSTTR